MTDRETVELPGLKATRSDDVQVVRENFVIPSGTDNRGFSGGSASAASVAGAIFIYLANTYSPQDESLRNLIVYAAPSVGVFLFYISQKILSFAGNSINSLMAERQRLDALTKAEIGLRKAEERLGAIENDPNATKEHKEKARNDVQNIQRAVIKLSVKGIIEIDD